MYVVQVFNGKRWAKVRGPEGGPWRTRDRAERIARYREEAEHRPSSTEGYPHRVVEDAAQRVEQSRLTPNRGAFLGDDLDGRLNLRPEAKRAERCPVCGGLNPGDITHTRCA